MRGPWGHKVEMGLELDAMGHSHQRRTDEGLDDWGNDRRLGVAALVGETAGPLL